MNSFAHYKIPAFALAIYFMLYVLFYDSLQYLLDSDAVAYLTIAHRGAHGDWARSVNGLWSPLNSWLLIPFIKNGIDSWTAAKGLNAFFGGVLIFQFWALLGQLSFSKFKIALGTFMVVLPVCFFAYFQMFGDVLQLIFALAYISLIIKKDFIFNKRLVLSAAILMGVAYYAKSYSLVFFGLHFSILACLAFFKKENNRKKVLLNYVLGIGTIVLVCLPWAFQLQKKYGEFALTGLAGKLNMSWYINSGKTFNDSITLMVPPAYDDSPSFWEDPYLSAGELSTPFSSAYHFKRWVLRVGHTCLIALLSVCEISLLFIPIFLFFLLKLLKRKKIPEALLNIFWACILLPLGYLAMHIETRYIWLLLFLIIILGFYLIEVLGASKKIKRLALLVFGVSILAFPLFQLMTLDGKNENLFLMAKELQENNVQGKIVTNLSDEGSFWVVSYLAGLKNYTIETSDFTAEQLVQEMKRYGISQYLHYVSPRAGGGVFGVNDLKENGLEEVASFSDRYVILYKLKN